MDINLNISAAMAVNYELWSTKTDFRGELVMSSQVRDVLEVVFTTSLIKDNINYYGKCIKDIMSQHEYVDIHTFIGQLNNRLNPIITNSSDYVKELSKLHLASQLTYILIDNDVLKIIKESPTFKSNGQLIKKPLKVFCGGNETTRLVVDGLSFEPYSVLSKFYKGLKVRGEHLKYTEHRSSTPFKLSKYATEDLLMLGYKLSKDYNTSSRYSSLTAKSDQYMKLASYVSQEVSTLEYFYLPIKYDGRLREYYEMATKGINPLGKAWELGLYESYQEYYPNQSGANHAKHVIVTLKEGRVTLNDAVKKYDAGGYEDYVRSFDISGLLPNVPYSSDTAYLYEEGESLLGDYLISLNALDVIIAFENGESTCSMINKDCTNSGGMTAAASFGGSKMLRPTNLLDPDNVHDGHQELIDRLGLDLTRKEGKDLISQGLHHGESFYTIASKLGISETEFTQRIIGTYGEEIMNIPTIAQWGSDILTPNLTQITFTTPDGYTVKHEARMLKTPIRGMHCITTLNKEGYTTPQFVRTMPISLDAKGQCHFSSGDKLTSEQKGIGCEVKRRGLYANIAHMLDAYLLRKISTAVYVASGVIISKHDDYVVMANHMDTIITVMKEHFQELHSNNYFQVVLDEIAAKYNLIAPVLLKSKDAPNIDCEHFLQP